MIRTHGADFAVGDPQRGLNKFFAEQSPAAVNENVGHDIALRRWLRERSGVLAASYFARNSSTARCRKSGRALRRGSWSQSHHASFASRSVMASANRRLMVRAGFPATTV